MAWVMCACRFHARCFSHAEQCVRSLDCCAWCCIIFPFASSFPFDCILFHLLIPFALPAGVVTILVVHSLCPACRWENDEPWNWDEHERWHAADLMAARVVHRQRERQNYLERLLAERWESCAVCTHTASCVFHMHLPVLQDVPAAVAACGCCCM